VINKHTCISMIGKIRVFLARGSIFYHDFTRFSSGEDRDFGHGDFSVFPQEKDRENFLRGRIGILDMVIFQFFLRGRIGRISSGGG